MTAIQLLKINCIKDFMLHQNTLYYISFIVTYIQKLWIIKNKWRKIDLRKIVKQRRAEREREREREKSLRYRNRVYQAGTFN